MPTMVPDLRFGSIHLSGKKYPFPSSLLSKTLARNFADGKMQVGFQIDQITKKSAYTFCSIGIYLYTQLFQAKKKAEFFFNVLQLQNWGRFSR